MAFTDQSALYGAVHEDGFNNLIHHVMRQRPSLFNYGTTWVAEDPFTRLCRSPEVSADVIKRQNPIVTIEPVLPLVGGDGAYGLNFCAQLTDLRIDFSPGTLELPPELGRLSEQQFALYAMACAGLGCPSKETLERFPPAPQPPIRLPRDARGDRSDDGRPRRDTIALPTDGLDCFCLDLFVVGHFTMAGPVGEEVIEAKVDGLEIVDVAPKGMENSVECYLRLLLHYVLLPRLRLALPVLVFEILDGIAEITLKGSTTAPHNPAVEDDQIKVFVDVEVEVGA
jgi:hypothetical protein